MADDRRLHVVGNWKMHGTEDDLAVLDRLAGADRYGVDVTLCLPATLLDRARTRFPALRFGAQDCDVPAGSLTGGITPAMLADAGARVVIVGHSERRLCLGETSGVVRNKAAGALAAGLTVILCVGECDERRPDEVLGELSASLPDAAAAGTLIVAYEPVWAIGTGRTPPPDAIGATVDRLRSVVAQHREGAPVPILYGGSVDHRNAAAIVAQGVDGLLVGGASRDGTTLAAIVAAVAP